MSVKGLDEIERLQRRKQALFNERSSFIAHWKELSAFTSPRLGRFFLQDRNRGTKHYQNIVNSRGTQALRTARAGLFAGVMSPSRPWLKLETPDPDMMSYQPVLEWLYKVETLLFAIFNSSNLYNMAPVMLGELLLFGTGAMTQLDDFDNVARFYTHSVGSYMIAQSYKFEVDTIVREFMMSCRQMVQQFGKNVSQAVMNAYDRGDYEAWFPVVHFVEPNATVDDAKLESMFKPFRSTYYEPISVNGSAPNRKPLEVKGFNEFPSYCPRWDVTGEDVYATDCPGMTSLGDIKALQALERRTAQAIDKLVDSPLSGPPSLKGMLINTLPGGATLYDGNDENQLKPLYAVQPQLQQHLLVTQHHESRIDSAYFVDLFRSIDSMEGIQPQNQMFLSQKNAEKLLILGPVLERLYVDFLNKLVDRTFNQCVRAKIPLMMQAPPEMKGQPLKVRYTGSLAMAQRSVANQGIDHFTMFIGGLMKAGFTTAADSLNVDETIAVYGRNEGIPPKLILPPEAIAAARQQHQQEAQQQQQMAAMAQTAGAANQGSQAIQNLSETQTASGGSALDNMASAAGGAPPL